uniref:Ion_trans domain-containing protein n=1 Tax=Angiostrongylus cantonensis TaxID=6313 RepID=A0A0K0D428_ANGCA
LKNLRNKTVSNNAVFALNYWKIVGSAVDTVCVVVVWWNFGRFAMIKKVYLAYNFFNSSNPSPGGFPRVRWTSSSMRNSFGLRFVYLFFNMPFLYLQRETLQRQLETNTEEIRCSDVELDCYHEIPDANYDSFMNAITQRRRRAAEVTGASALCGSPGSTDRQPIGGGRPIPGQILPMRWFLTVVMFDADVRDSVLKFFFALT